MIKTTLIVRHTFLKYIYIASLSKKLFLFFVAFLGVYWDMKDLFTAFLFFTFLDFITGVQKDMFYQGLTSRSIFSKDFRKTVKSRKIRAGIEKTKNYLLGVLIFAVVELLITGKISLPIIVIERQYTVTELSLLIPIGNEIWSIFENREAITGKNILKTGLSLIKKPSK